MSVRVRLFTVVVLGWVLLGTLGVAPTAARAAPSRATAQPTSTAVPTATATTSVSPTPTARPARPTPSQSPATRPSAPLDPSLPTPVGWWPGDGTAVDVIAGNNGTFSGTYGPGVVNQAFHMDGSGQAVVIPDAASQHPTVLSVTAWVRLDSLNTGGSGGGNEYLVFKQNTGLGDFEGYTLLKEDYGDGTHHVVFVCSQPGDGQAIAGSTTPVTTGVWYFLVGTYDGTAVRLYVDGTLEASVPAAGPLNVGTTPLYFGTTGQSYFDGKLDGSLDEVKLYNVVLSPAQVAQLFSYDARSNPRGEALPAWLQYLDKLSSGSGGDPVQTFTGNYTYRHTDLAIPGRGPSPVFGRSYSSGDSRVGVLGPGWTENYATRLVTPPGSTGNLALVLPDGATRLYTYANGVYTPPAEDYTTLVHNGDGTYTVTQTDQTTWSFDAGGRLTALKDRYGNTSTLTYNASGQLTAVSDPAGRGSLSFGYDAGTGRLTSITDWASPARSVQFGYDSQLRLQTVKNRAGKVTTYGYQGTSSLLTSITDANQHTALTLSYDSQGRVQTQTDALNNQTTFGYVTNGDGTTTTTVTAPATSFDGFHPTVADTYDSSGRLIKRVSTPSGSDGSSTETYTYDATSNLASVTDPRGNTTAYCYDTGYNGQPTATAHGDLTRTISPPPASGQNPLVSLSAYDTATGPGTASVVNNLVETIPPKGVSNGSSVTCSTNLSSSVNVNYATDDAYDASKVFLQTVTQRFTDPDKGLQTAVTTYQYGDASNPGAVTAVVPPLGSSHTTSYRYFGSGSEAGMLQQVTDALGDTTSYSYDAVGRRLTMTDPDGGVWSYRYDAEDRLLSTSTPAVNGSPLTTQDQYDAVGNRTVVIDASGQVTKYLYDARDALSEVDQSPAAWTNPGAQPSPLYRTTYSYDHNGNLSRIDRATGDATNERATDYQYDGSNRLRKEIQYPAWPATSPTLVTTSGYDGDNNPVSLVDPLSQTTTSGYDALNRLTSITYSDGVTPNVAYTYDANGNRLTMADGTGTTSYVADERNRLTSVTQPTTGTEGYRYDTDGNETKLIYPNANAVTYAYDTADRLQTVTDWASRVTSYQYFADGQLQQRTNVDGTTATYAYDPAQRLTQVTDQQGSAILDQQTYTLDALGNPTQVAEILPQLTTVGGLAPAKGASASSPTPSAPRPLVPSTLVPLRTGLPAAVVPPAPTGGRLPLPLGGPAAQGHPAPSLPLLTATTTTPGGAQPLMPTSPNAGVPWGWGDDYAGPLGDGTTTNRSSPQPVAGQSGVRAVAGGLGHSLILHTDGTVWAMGDNTYGELGDGTTTSRQTPEQVPGLSGVSAIAAGAIFSVVLKTDGTVWTFGDNADGELGTGSSGGDSLTPVQVVGLAGITAIATEGFHTLALKNDGTVWAWGYGAYGELGTGTVPTSGCLCSPTPVQVSGLTGVSAIAAGAFTSYALGSGGSV